MPGWNHTSSAQRVVFGAGTADSIAAVLKDAGGRRAMLVTSERALAGNDGQRLVKRLGRSLVSTFSGSEPHVPASALQAALRQAHGDGIDSLVSFGGGSSIDLAKGVAYFTEQEAGTPGVSFIDRPVLAHVAVPTTYTGTSCTATFSVTDPRTRSKTGAGSSTTAPIAVIIDSKLTLDTPVRLSVESAVGALGQCVETMWATHRTPEAEALAAAGAARLAGAIGLLVDDPGDSAVRDALAVGAVLAGRAMQNSSLGALLGLAQLLGGRTGIGHGLAMAVLLPHVMTFNREVTPAELTQFGLAIGDPDDPIGAIVRLLEQLELPMQLDACGVSLDDLEAVARMAPGNPLVQRNPRPMTEADAHGLLEAAWWGVSTE
ncbi:MAG: iron-containing alcohol dehydrogenase family protein [Acidimicrobiia bacterium]